MRRLANLLSTTAIFAFLTTFGGCTDGSAEPDVDSINTKPSAESIEQSQGLSDKESRYLQDAEHLGGFVFGDVVLPAVPPTRNPLVRISPAAQMKSQIR